MAQQKKQPTPEPVKSVRIKGKRGEPTPAQAARKEANRKRNEAQHQANLERKARGELTPHEAKKAARGIKRIPKQQAYERAQEARQRALDARETKREKDSAALATELLRAKSKGARKAVAEATVGS